ncbi:MAG: sigma 54-interacting transcriptional regulator [Thermoguttaceae bacterium]
MEQSQRILLSVWQEACRHIEIGQSLASIAATLARHIPVEQVLVRRIDTVRSGLETVAADFSESEGHRLEARTNCSPAELQSLLEWCRRGKVSHHRGEESAAVGLTLLASNQHEGDVAIGPLGDAAGHCGVLVLLASKNRTFAPEHIELAQLLLEPISVAFDNDLRLREMAALREAAEADKRSLLTRLGRKTLGDTIVGVESGLHAVMDRVELVARSDAPVLIFGETGTGKELIARAIHSRSSRRNGPFDRVNCGAIPPELIDSQLFGHERGAFTGAVEARRGWFERADGGTLFLDEIGELPPAAQVRMLRILQDGWMERVGSEKSINVDVRIVAATHADLVAMVAEGDFREDLWYRIAVFPIVLPPLRERREDIPRLASHFAERAATRFGLAPVAPKPEDLALLASYSWPGNVRELAAVIDRAAILGDGKRLDVATALGVTADSPHGAASGRIARVGDSSKRRAGDSTSWVGSSTATPTRTSTATPTGSTATSTASPVENPSGAVSAAAIEPLDAAIRRHIESALAAAAGRIEGRQGAAAMLKINPHTLRAKMRKLGIDWARFRVSS